MRRPATWPLLAVLLVAAGADPGRAAGQAATMIDRGRFEISLDGAARGQESFAIRREGAGLMAVGRLSREGAGAGIESAEVGLRTDARAVPLRYEYRSLQRPVTRIIATRTGRRIRITTTDPEGERMTELASDPGLVLLQPGITHQYWFLVHRLRDGGPAGELEVLDPQAVRRLPVEVLSREDTALETPSGGMRPAAELSARIDGVLHRIWSDPGTGAILRVEIPERGWHAVRVADRPDSEDPAREDRP